jgi:peptide/nickel transport system permease protein
MSNILSSLKGKKSDAEDPAQAKQGEEFFRASQWQLVWWKFRRHKLAQIAMIILGLLYFLALFAEFVTPHNPLHRYRNWTAMQPTRFHLFDTEGNFRGLFVYGVERTRDPQTFRPVYAENTDQIYPVKLFVRGDSYRMWGLFPSDLHLFGTEPYANGEQERPIFILGSDSIGRDVLTRIVFGARISLTVGLIGIALSFIFGLLLGGLAGYFGGVIDEVIMRLIDVLISLPTIPLWMSLAAALPQDWPQLRTYFYVTIILSIIGWTGLARTVRGKLLALREEDYVMAARLDGESEFAIITRYMLPGFASYIIVALTLAIPGMILGETSLSFLGIGLHAPTISWGVMLQDAQDLQVVSQLPWLLWPVVFVVLAVLMFNFLGDGMRDAADPYVTG